VFGVALFVCSVCSGITLSGPAGGIEGVWDDDEGSGLERPLRGVGISARY